MDDLRPEPDGHRAFRVADRESFLAAIARHRRASWRVTAACAVAVIVVAVAVAILMAPLLYCVIGLGFDVVNLVKPAPDVMGWMGRQIDALASARTVPTATLVRAGAVAAVPGLALMSAVTYGLRHTWMRSPLFDAGDLPGRPPDRTVLAEERLANVVEEMAIAAGIPVPRVVIVQGGVNAAACGRDESHVTLLVGEALAAGVGRDELQGMMAHLVGSVADGDMTIGLRVTTTLALFGLVARVGGSFTDRREFWRTAKLWRVFLRPTSTGTVALLGALTDPFDDTASADAGAPGNQESGMTWREWLLMPLMGPVLLTGFLSGLVTQFLLEPLVALAWRQRKYMADATAVELTRNPDGLAAALNAIADSPKGIAPWTAHLAVAGDPSGQDGPFGRSIVPIFPSSQKRLAALVKMGAHAAPKTRPRVPWLAALVLTVLASILGALMAVVVGLLVFVSTALSGLFTVMPAALLHVVLRWMAR
jgi:Zn-dependent protease with chaperone function